PFDLARGPLIRAGLLRLGPREHVVVVTMHHIVSDGWSIGVLLRELSILYDTFAAGRPSPLPELPVQYADFAVWQREWLTGEVLEAQLGYWREQLSGAPAVLELPADRPRPAVRSVKGGQRSAALPLELSEALGWLARQWGATPFMVLLAAFQALLGRLTGQEDLTTGSPVANRNRGETEGLIGFFVNTLVLRGDLSGAPGFGELLARVRETALGAYAHQDLPFEKLVAEIQPERDLSRSPLFQVMLIVQNLPRAARDGWRLVALPEGGGTAKFDLTLFFGEAAEGGWAAQAEYRRDLFDDSTIDRLLAHFTALLTAVVQAPERRVTELPLLRDAERQQLLVEWNDTAAVSTAQDVCLHELITTQLARDPEAVAVTFEGESLTCRELDRRAGCLANTLRRLGVGPERRVGVAMERSLEMVVALLGVLRAGAAYLPLDPSYPPERLAFMLEDGLGEEGEPPVLLTQKRLLDTLPSLQGRILCLEAGWDGNGESGSLRDVEVLPDHPAYVIYTSGSTGRPKGVVTTHRAIVNRLLWMQQAYGLTAEDRVLQKTPFSFDVSVWELFWPLLAGARMVLARPGGHQDPDYLVDLIERERVTTLHFVPSMLQVFLEHPLKHPEVERCASLRTVVCSGEALPFDLQERFWSRFPRGVGLHNLYGPTEAAVDVTSWACERESALRSVPIGRPIANLRIHLLDAGLHPVPAGVPGELHIGGVGLARGYLRRPGLTAEKLIPDPFSETAGARLYRTGDLARHRTDGRVEYLGRIDHQVKLRGFRIELGEIEAALAALPVVREVVVMMREDKPGDRRLVAYLVLEETVGREIQDILRAGLQARLPEYMVPSAFVVLPALPLSPNGKVDRRALGLHVLPEEGERSGFVPPETEEERRMAAIWTEILGVPRVGLQDDFFRLGGHSLLATRVIARLRRDFQVDLPLRSLFQTPTIAGLLELVRQFGQSRPPAPAPRISTLSRSASQLRSRAALGSREEP
ncbi:MAG TPA: amino acid adenylation domain-containing protein, partial [Thermoanaerobaculia bacterium]|nr:amino acid adenylation domain-containing protein [Thermoanaerobaculia bacterium]